MRATGGSNMVTRLGSQTIASLVLMNILISLVYSFIVPQYVTDYGLHLLLGQHLQTHG